MLAVSLWAEGLGIAIFDTFTWQRLHLITGTEYVISVAFSPDGRRLVSGEWKGAVRLWDSTSGEELLVMKGHTDLVRSLAYSPCGNRIASAGGKTVRLWDALTGECIFVVEGHTDLVRSVKYSSDGQQLVSGSKDGTIRFWNSGTGEPGVVWNPSLGEIHNLAISPDGRWIASGHDDGKVRLWDVVSGSPGSILQSHTKTVKGIAFSPDSQSIVSGMDSKVMLWDAPTGTLISSFDGHSHSVYGVTFSPDGLTLVSGSDDGTLRLWETSSSPSRTVVQNQISDAVKVAYSPDGPSVLFIDRLGVLRQGDATTGEGGSVSFEFPNLESIYSLAFSSDVSQIAAGCVDGSVRSWDRGTGAAAPVLEGHSSAVRLVAYSTCGRWIASSDDDRTVRMWDFRGTEKRYVLIDAGAGNDSEIVGLKFSPTDHQLAVCSEGGKVWLFNPETGALLTSKKLVEGSILALDYSPNGQQLAFSTDTSIALWDLQSDEPGLELNVPVSSDDPFGKSMAVTYSPCGQILASFNEAYIVHLWHRHSTKENIESWSCALEFITASDDGSVRAWRVSSDDGTVAVKMLWGTNLRRLCTAGVVLEGATGLSPTHHMLLTQRSSFAKGSSSNNA
ncbi:wD repeat domain [Linnemannia elongata]|nr:wD repeat domain [Linnemannia elongata]